MTPRGGMVGPQQIGGIGENLWYMMVHVKRVYVCSQRSELS